MDPAAASPDTTRLISLVPTLDILGGTADVGLANRSDHKVLCAKGETKYVPARLLRRTELRRRSTHQDHHHSDREIRHYVNGLVASARKLARKSRYLSNYD